MFRWTIPALALTSGLAAPLTITTLNPHLAPPEAWNWNVTAERQLPLNSVLTVAYVAHRGLHAWQVYDINQPTVGALQAAPAGTNPTALRPYKGFAAIQEEESVVNSMYNSLQISWERRFTNGSSFGVTYTLSKSMDNGSNYRDIAPDTYNTSNLWGPSEYDTRHMLMFNYIYDLPFFKNAHDITGKVLGVGKSPARRNSRPARLAASAPITISPAWASSAASAAVRKASSGTSTGPVQINTGAFAGPVTNSSSPKYFTANVSQPAPGPSTCNRVSATPSTSPVSRIGTSRWIRLSPSPNEAHVEFRAEAYDFINHAESERPEPESHFQPVRHDYQQDRVVAQSAAFPATLVLTPGSADRGCDCYTQSAIRMALNPTPNNQFGMITSKAGLSRNRQLALRFTC